MHERPETSFGDGRLAGALRAVGCLLLFALFVGAPTLEFDEAAASSGSPTSFDLASDVDSSGDGFVPAVTTLPGPLFFHPIPPRSRSVGDASPRSADQGTAILRFAPKHSPPATPAG